MDMFCMLCVCGITLTITLTESVNLVTKITKTPTTTDVEDNLTKTTSFKEEEQFSSGVCKHGENDLTLYDKSLEQCVDECRSRTLCTAINAYLKVGVCRLNFQTGLPESNCLNYIHWERATWIKQWENGCESLNCSLTQKCVKINGSHSCVTSECSNITDLPNREIFGNRVKVGMKKAFRCNHGYILNGSSSITCQSDGNWSPDEPVCTEKPTQYVYKGYNDECEVTGDGEDTCSEIEHECRRNTCRCIVTLVFDPNKNKCVRDCIKYGMSTYQKFENAKLIPYYPVFETHAVPDVKTCLAHCEDFIFCNTVVMSKSDIPGTFTCYVHRIVSQAFAGNHLEIAEGYDCYFLGCADETNLP